MSGATEPRVVPEPPPPPDDASAQKEAAALAAGKLRRSESRERHLHAGGLILFWFLIFSFIVVAAVWLFNLVTPANWHFLSSSATSNLQNVIIAAIGSTTASEYAKKMLNRDRDWSPPNSN